MKIIVQIMEVDEGIKVYSTRAFTGKYMPSESLKAIMDAEQDSFFITKLEEMYKLVTRNVTASRSTIHSCLFVTEGEVVMKIGSEQYKVHKNEILFVPAGQVFSFQIGDENTGYICGFHNDFLLGKFAKAELWKEYEFLRVWGNPMIRPDEQTSGYIINIVQRLLAEYTQNGLGNQAIIQVYLYALFSEIQTAYKPLSSSNLISAVSITNRFKEYIFSSIKTKHLVTDYASMLNISPNHLNKTVKKITGKSPAKWIDEAIIAEAKVLLCQSGMSISEVSLEVGFEDQSYFTRLFKKYEEITPSEFRKMIETS